MFKSQTERDGIFSEKDVFQEWNRKVEGKNKSETVGDDVNNFGSSVADKSMDWPKRTKNLQKVSW